MNKYDEEYEKMNLCDFADELVEPLNTVKQDLTKTIYIHYAKERDENEQLKEQRQELRSWLENEKDRLARECSQIYEDSLGKTRLVSEDIFNEVNKILSKLNELEGENE